jgi:hypothetical protein
MRAPIKYILVYNRGCGRRPDKAGNAMKQIFPRFSTIAFALLALAAGCASPEEIENLLSQAGFRTVTITSSQQRQFPPHKVTITERNGKTDYVYADPARNQFYIGNQAQYQKYRQLKKELEAAQQSYNPPVCE